MSVEPALWTVSPRRTVMDTPGKGPPSPVMVPVIVHAAAAGGACCALSATPAISKAIAAPLSAVVDILVRKGIESPKMRRPVMSLQPRRVARASVRVPQPAQKTKRCHRPINGVFLLSLLVLNVLLRHIIQRCAAAPLHGRFPCSAVWLSPPS